MYAAKQTIILGFAVFLILLGWYLYAHDIQLKKYVQTSSPLSQTRLIDARKLTFNMGTKQIAADVVVTEESREKGLGGRPYLEDNTGMFFIFPKPDFYAFWMKDMTFPIDIIWLSAEMKVVDIKERVEPSTYPNQSFTPREKALYVLEVSSGDVAASGLKIGDTITEIK